MRFKGVDTPEVKSLSCNAERELARQAIQFVVTHICEADQVFVRTLDTSLGHSEVVAKMQYFPVQRRLPLVLMVDEAAQLIAAASSLKYLAAFLACAKHRSSQRYVPENPLLGRFGCRSAALSHCWVRPIVGQRRQGRMLSNKTPLILLEHARARWADRLADWLLGVN